MIRSLFLCLVVFSSFWLGSMAFKEDAFIVDAGSIYQHYPHTLFENLFHKTLSPAELMKPPVYTATSFSRPFAKNHIKTGDVILELTKAHRIDEALIYSELPCLKNIAFSFPEELYIFWLIYHDHLFSVTGTVSPHSTFILSLPRNIINPITFQQEDWAALKFNTLSEQVNNLVTTIRTGLNQMATTSVTQLGECPEQMEVFKLTTEEYIWAYSIVKDLIKTIDGVSAIYPALNFAHSPDGHSIKFSNGILSVVAAHDISPREQILVNFGDVSNMDLMLYHSSFVENNYVDCISFSHKVKNAYWMTLAGKTFGYTSSKLEQCAPLNLKADDQVLIELRTAVATSTELNQLSQILKGERISLSNELKALRALYAAVRNQLTESKLDSTRPGVMLWDLYAQDHSKAVTILTDRIMELWESHIGL